jgi:hypothetical protein
VERRLAALLLLCATLVLTGCEDEITGPDPITVEDQLFRAMNLDDYGSAGFIVGEMYEIRNQDPLNYRNTFMLGATALWWIAEVQRAGTNPLLVISQAIPFILESFSDVIQNDLENRPVALALLGAFLAETGLDRAAGASLVEQATALSPEVGHFQRMHIRRGAPVDDAETTLAVEAGFQFWEACLGEQIDRVNPDFTGKVRPPTEVLGPNFCWGSSRVPHGYEGTWLIFGDMLVKAGRLETARRAYLNAKLGPNYERWLHKSALEERLRSDLAARAATYLQRDPTKWAPIGLPPFSCTQCHASIRQ